MLLPGSKTNRTQRTRLLRDADEFKTGFGEGWHKVSIKSVKRTYRNGEKEGGGCQGRGVVSSRVDCPVFMKGCESVGQRIRPTGQWEGGLTRFGSVFAVREGGVFEAGDVGSKVTSLPVFI